MKDNVTRRFGVHEVNKGKFKGSLHIATASYRKFFSELLYLNDYLERRIIPTEPEEAHMRGIILNLQNMLESESEELIRNHIQSYPTDEDRRFLEHLNAGYASFKSKFEWLMEKGLIGTTEHDIMEEMRLLRNDLIHARPRSNRIRLKYFQRPLLALNTLRKLFIDVESVLRNLRKYYDKEPAWPIIPPGFASEMGWPIEAIKTLDKKKQALEI